MTKSVIQTVLELRQVGGPAYFPEEPVPATDHPLSEEPSPFVQSELPLMQLHPISIYLSMICMQALNAPLASVLMIPNWKVLLTVLSDKMLCRAILPD